MRVQWVVGVNDAFEVGEDKADFGCFEQADV